MFHYVDRIYFTFVHSCTYVANRLSRCGSIFIGLVFATYNNDGALIYAFVNKVFIGNKPVSEPRDQLSLKFIWKKKPTSIQEHQFDNIVCINCGPFARHPYVQSSKTILLFSSNLTEAANDEFLGIYWDNSFTTSPRYSDVSWAAIHPKSPVTQLFVRKLIQANTKKNTKTPHFSPFVTWIQQQWPWLTSGFIESRHVRTISRWE